MSAVAGMARRRDGLLAVAVLGAIALALVTMDCAREEQQSAGSIPIAPPATTPKLPEPPAPAPKARESGKEAPDFLITVYQGEGVLGGKTVSLSQLRGKPLVLNFYAGNCPPCRAEMPDFQAVYQQYQDKVLLMGLDVGPFTGLGSREDGQKLLRDLAITYPAGTTLDSTVPAKYGVLAMPTTVSINQDGTILRKALGQLSRQQINILFEELLRASRK